LLSVSDRTGLLELAQALVSHGYELLSTGGTAQVLESAGLPVSLVSDLTGFPEIFGGRVKTLHPKLFGGVLFDRSVERHVAEAVENEIPPIDLVAVNLYPFEETPAIEKIDVGGPSLLRAAAKNHAHVTVLCDSGDYPPVIDELNATGGTVSLATRRHLAAKVFRRTASYDAAIARWFQDDGEALFPERLTLPFALGKELRYGENPHQRGAFYVDPAASPSALSRFTFVQGKELSYNNLLDADSALFAARAIGSGAATIVKHRIPSGAALGDSLASAFAAAWESDPVAGFGGVVAFTGRLDAEGAKALTARFLEVVVAHEVDDDARPILAAKPNLRVLTVRPDAGPRHRLEVRGVDGGLLVQESDVRPDDEPSWKCVTARQPSDGERSALRFAWKAVRGVISNAIVVTNATATLGIGGGRTSRVDACRDAVAKAASRAVGAVAGSDAFFPFPDGLEVLAEAGVTAIIQPGGSMRDSEGVAAADARGLSMVVNGRRHFRH